MWFFITIAIMWAVVLTLLARYGDRIFGDSW